MGVEDCSSAYFIGCANRSKDSGIYLSLRRQGLRVPPCTSVYSVVNAFDCSWRIQKLEPRSTQGCAEKKLNRGAGRSTRTQRVPKEQSGNGRVSSFRPRWARSERCC